MITASLLLDTSNLTTPRPNVSRFYLSNEPLLNGFAAGSWEAMERNGETPKRLLNTNSASGPSWVNEITLLAQEAFGGIKTPNEVLELRESFKRNSNGPVKGSTEELICILLSALALRIVEVDSRGRVQPISVGDTLAWADAMEGLLINPRKGDGTVCTYPVIDMANANNKLASGPCKA